MPLGLAVLGMWFGIGLDGMTSAQAATATGSLGVQIVIEASCTVSSVTDVDFGTTGVLVANVDATGAVGVTCSNGLAYNVGLNAGTGLGASVTARKMTGGAETVTYSLYQDAGRSTVWGNTIGTDTETGTGNGSEQVLTVYGRVPPQTTPTAGTYTDTVTVTVSY